MNKISDCLQQQNFSWKFRPREFNATDDRVQCIDDITIFLNLAANKFSFC